MTDFKSAAEQQVRETLGWWIECSNTLCFERYQERHGDIATREEAHAHQLAVSKTAELLEMTAQRDEAQKALEIAIQRRDEMQEQNRRLEKKVTWVSPPELRTRAESAEATIREQAERIKELERGLGKIMHESPAGSRESEIAMSALNESRKA